MNNRLILGGHPLNQVYKRGVMTVDEFLNRLKKDNGQKLGTHHLEPGLTNRELTAWKAINPDFNLPSDFLFFLQKANGVRIRTDLEPTMGVFRLLPLREIQFAPRLMYGENKSLDSEFPQSWLALGVDPDSTLFLMLDIAQGQYLKVDPIDPHEPDLLATNLEGVLGWVIQFTKEE